MAEPTSVTETPAGQKIEYFDGSQGTRRKYLIDGEQLPSVTTVLRVLDKPALLSWAQRIGVAGAIQLARDGGLPQDVDMALGIMRREELCHWQVRDKASDRGTLAHEDLVALATKGTVPDLDAYPLAQRGFIQGVCAWYADHLPETLDAETIVASTKYGFAGRYDLRCRIKGRTLLCDLKTMETLHDKRGKVKPPFDENLLQLEAYEIASNESGYEATDARAVIRVDAQGRYDMTESWAATEDFLGVLEAHRALKALHGRKPREKREKAAA